MTIILASASPRRREFLRQLRIPFRVVIPRVTETPCRGELPAEFAHRAAIDKAHWVAARQRGRGSRVIVAADTIVVFGRRILQKPRSRADAAGMLRLLSGRWHEVITGVCVTAVRGSRIVKEHSTVVRTAVAFKKLVSQEIRSYVASGEPMDKAGAYAVQGRGSFMVRSLCGSYTNVVGLPMAELIDILEGEFGFRM